jgi:glycoside/pentoside/hexuronide:cation symporter, GPH family
MIIFSLTNSMIVVSPYFAVNILGKAEMATLVIAVTAFPMLLVAFFVPMLVKRFGKFKLYLFFTVWFIVSCGLVYFVGYSNFAILMTAMLVRGIGFGFVMVMMFMFAPDCVEYGTFKSGNRAAGITFSMQSFAIKLTSGLSAALTMLLLSFFGFVEGAGAVQPTSAINGIWLLISIFPAIGALFSVPIFLQYRLPEKDVEIMAQANSEKITREEALKQLSKAY